MTRHDWEHPEVHVESWRDGRTWRASASATMQALNGPFRARRTATARRRFLPFRTRADAEYDALVRLHTDLARDRERDRTYVERRVESYPPRGGERGA